MRECADSRSTKKHEKKEEVFNGVRDTNPAWVGLTRRWASGTIGFPGQRRV